MTRIRACCARVHIDEIWAFRAYHRPRGSIFYSHLVASVHSAVAFFSLGMLFNRSWGRMIKREMPASRGKQRAHSFCALENKVAPREPAAGEGSKKLGGKVTFIGFFIGIEFRRRFDIVSFIILSPQSLPVQILLDSTLRARFSRPPFISRLPPRGVTPGYTLACNTLLHFYRPTYLLALPYYWTSRTSSGIYNLSRI